MSVVVAIDLIDKDGHLEPVTEQLHKILLETKAYDGCLFLKMAVYEGKTLLRFMRSGNPRSIRRRTLLGEWQMATS